MVDAISVGSIYALMALALGLLFGVMGLLNFAYGELVMVGGYTMFYLREEPWPLMILVTVATVTLVSLVMERIAFRPIRQASPMTLLITSFAISVALQTAARLSVGPIPKGVAPWPALIDTYNIYGVQISRLDILTAVTVVALLIALGLLLKRTMLGTALRASTENFDMARLLGVRANRVIAGAFAITGVLAGAVALLLVARTGAVSPTMGLGPLLVAFVGVVIGGIGNLVGAAVGGFVLGALITSLQASLPVSLSGYTEALAFGAVIAILVLRPRGLFGTNAAREI
jgi:branched-chain amino acid transport system permease protein